MKVHTCLQYKVARYIDLCGRGSGGRHCVTRKTSKIYPGTSSFTSMESSVPKDNYLELIDLFLNTDESNFTLYDGPGLSLPSFPSDSKPCNDTFFWPADTEQDHGSSPPMMSPISTYSCSTMPSTPEVAEALNAMDGAKSVIDNNSGNCINMSNPESSVLSPELSKPGCSKTCTGCMRPASACHDDHGLTASEVEIRRQEFFKGVKKKNSNKWTCEIRISKKLHKDSELGAKGKLWIGTFDTRCQAARALHVGRFFLSEKKNSRTDATNFEQSSKTILSDFKDFMRGKKLDVKLLDRVKELAIGYGKNGSL